MSDEIDVELLELTDQELEEAANEIHRTLASNGFDYAGQTNAPAVELMAQIGAIKHILQEKGLVEQHEFGRLVLAFKVSHMRMIAAEILPQLRAAQARAAILAPGNVPPHPTIEIPRGRR